MYKKKTYIGFGTNHSFKRPLGVLECIRGDYCVYINSLNSRFYLNFVLTGPPAQLDHALFSAIKWGSYLP